MFIFRPISDATTKTKFKGNIASRTRPYRFVYGPASGLYSRTTKNTVSVYCVPDRESLRGEPMATVFYGIIIPWFSKTVLVGWMGPSMLVTAFLFSTALSPVEDMAIRIAALGFWLLVYICLQETTRILRKTKVLKSVKKPEVLKAK